MHGFRREQPRRLMVPVSRVHSAPPIDHHVRAEHANHPHHIFKNLFAPDFFGFFRRLREAKIFRTREIQFHAVAARGGQQFLGANQSQLWRLFRPKVILPALASCQGKQSHVCVESSGQIGQHCARLIVWMRRHVKDSRGNARTLDRFHRLRQSRAGSRCWRELCVSAIGKGRTGATG